MTTGPELYSEGIAEGRGAKGDARNTQPTSLPRTPLGTPRIHLQSFLASAN